MDFRKIYHPDYGKVMVPIEADHFEIDIDKANEAVRRMVAKLEELAADNVRLMARIAELEARAA